MDAADWRSELTPDSRNWIVNKITETLKRHFELSGQEGLVEVKKIAVRFEEKIYNAASSPCDYLTKITMRLLPMENYSQNTLRWVHQLQILLAVVGILRNQVKLG
ncbi:hypothetical protein QQ045_019072 [Rhodiola kirilowii]